MKMETCEFLYFGQIWYLQVRLINTLVVNINFFDISIVYKNNPPYDTNRRERKTNLLLVDDFPDTLYVE